MSEFLKRNMGVNVDLRKEIAREAAIKDWKIDSTREAKKVQMIKSLIAKKIFIIGEGSLMGASCYNIFNCFNKKIVSLKWVCSDGRISTSADLPFYLEPGEVKLLPYVANSNAKDINALLNSELTGITLKFSDGTTQAFYGAQIKAHKKCLG